MTHLFQFERKTTPFNAAVVEIDVDPVAERYAIMSRIDLSVISHGLVPADGNVKVIVPLQYTNDYNLMALLLDDGGDPLHYVTGNDKVQAELVDARLVTLNP